MSSMYILLYDIYYIWYIIVGIFVYISIDKYPIYSV